MGGCDGSTLRVTGVGHEEDELLRIGHVAHESQSVIRLCFTSVDSVGDVLCPRTTCQQVGSHRCGGDHLVLRETRCRELYLSRRRERHRDKRFYNRINWRQRQDPSSLTYEKSRMCCSRGAAVVTGECSCCSE